MMFLAGKVWHHTITKDSWQKNLTSPLLIQLMGCGSISVIVEFMSGPALVSYSYIYRFALSKWSEHSQSAMHKKYLWKGFYREVMTSRLLSNSKKVAKLTRGTQFQKLDHWFFLYPSLLHTFAINNNNNWLYSRRKFIQQFIFTHPLDRNARCCLPKCSVSQQKVVLKLFPVSLKKWK